MHWGSINHGVHVTGLRRHLWGSSMSGSSCVFEISEKINYMKEPWCPCTCNSLVNHRSGEYLECLVYPINYWSRKYVTVTWLRLVTRPPYWQKGKTNAAPIADRRTYVVVLLLRKAEWFVFFCRCISDKLLIHCVHPSVCNVISMYRTFVRWCIVQISNQNTVNWAWFLPLPVPGDSWIDNPKEMAERAIPGRIHVSRQDTGYVIQF